MGSYLSTPVCEKLSDDFIGKLSYGASSMQGWRSSQEDAHNCQVNFDSNTETSLFAVYDGHGGAEVAIYASKHFPDFLKCLSLYKNGDLHKALEEAFIGFDATLIEEAVIKQLKDIAGAELDEEDMDEIEEVKNEAALLREEATMPIEKLMQRYNGKMSSKSKNKEYDKEINNGTELDEKVANGFHECNDKRTTSSSMVEGNRQEDVSSKNGEVLDVCNKSESLDKADIGAHCSRGAISSEEDDDEENDSNDDDDDDSDDDKWNSEENDSDYEDDDDEEEDSEGFSISKLFKSGEEDEFEPLGFGETPGADSGCTAVVALLRGQDLYVANAGDSRCVLCRGQTAYDMSVDHKPEDDVEKTRIHKAGGKITADGRVNGGLNLSRAIGDHAYKRNTKLELKEQMITAMPDIKHMALNKDDKFMVLACDGIWNVLTSQEVVDFILKRIEMGENKLSNICEELFDTCLAPDTTGDGTGCDNMTCIIVKFPVISTEKSQADTIDVKTFKRKHSSDEEELPAKRCWSELIDGS